MSYLQLLKKASVAMCFLSAPFIAMAQTATVRGTVKDPAGHPLSGASIIIQGRSGGTTTNNQGEFSLSVPAGTYIVNASYVGYITARQTVTLSVGASSTVDFVLAESGQEQAVVILGSRALPRTQLETPAPVDVIDLKKLAADILA